MKNKFIGIKLEDVILKASDITIFGYNLGQNLTAVFNSVNMNHFICFPAV